MKTSARNDFPGTVRQVLTGQVDAEVIIDVGGGQEMVSVITVGSVDHLELIPGKPVTAMVKASSVILMAGGPARTSARNQFCGTVAACREGAVNGEVTVALAGGAAITAIITNESIRKLGLAPGVPACALVKASNVILAVED